LISLNLDNAAVTGQRVVDQHSDLAGGNVGERKLAPYVSIAGHVTAGNIHPGRPSPILHIEICHAVLTELHAESWRGRTGIVVLKREEIYFIDRLAGTEIYLHPVRIGIGCRIIPTTTGSPIQSFAIAVIDRGDRIATAVS
jgi:hypothetical protein